MRLAGRFLSTIVRRPRLGLRVAGAGSVLAAGALFWNGTAAASAAPNIPQSDESQSYSSRQLALFDPKVSAAAGAQVETKTKVDPIHMLKVPHLSEQLPKLETYPNTVQRTKLMAEKSRQVQWYSQYISDKDQELILLDIVRKNSINQSGKGFVRAGPRERIVWKPKEVKAAIVTCGGLCPGLNDVIEELVNTLYYNYGVDHIYGIKNGFRGFWQKDQLPFMSLTPQTVGGISQDGGTVLGASRGGYDKDKILEACKKQGINQLYIIGGDGTHRAADDLFQEVKKRGLKMTIAGVPKTIDNDIGTIDKSFGFDTSVEEARKAIYSARVEARCTPNGIGIVRLMGRHAGYISAHATLAARNVDLCLIPEVEFPLDGDKGIFPYMDRVLETQGHGVIVVAEGAGEHLFAEIKETDESGNKILPDTGKYLQKQLAEYFKKRGKSVSLKYHDPSYMVRSVPANASDSVYCEILAQNAVHGAMAGYTGFTSAQVNNRTVYLPVATVCATSPSYMNPLGRTWERVVATTQQPNWLPEMKEKLKQRKAAAAAAPPAKKSFE